MWSFWGLLLHFVKLNKCSFQTRSNFFFNTEMTPFWGLYLMTPTSRNTSGPGPVWAALGIAWNASSPQTEYDYSTRPSYGKPGVTYRITAERPSPCVWPTRAGAAGPHRPASDVKMMGPLDLARLGPTGANIVTQVCGCVEEEEGWLRVIPIYRNRHGLSVFPENYTGCQVRILKRWFQQFLLHS